MDLLLQSRLLQSSFAHMVALSIRSEYAQNNDFSVIPFNNHLECLPFFPNSLPVFLRFARYHKVPKINVLLFGLCFSEAIDWQL